MVRHEISLYQILLHLGLIINSTKKSVSLRHRLGTASKAYAEEVSEKLKVITTSKDAEVKKVKNAIRKQVNTRVIQITAQYRTVVAAIEGLTKTIQDLEGKNPENQTEQQKLLSLFAKYRMAVSIADQSENVKANAESGSQAWPVGELLLR